MVYDVEISDLPCLYSENNSNLTSYNMADLGPQLIAVDGKKYPALEEINFPKNIPLSKL